MSSFSSLHGRVVSFADLPAGPTVARSWWGDEPWRRFTARAHHDDLRFLVIESTNGELCATAPLMLSTEETGAFYLKPPGITGDERAFGDQNRLTAEERADYDALRTRLSSLRAGQYPSVAISTRGSDHGVAVAPASPVSPAEIFEALPELLADAAASLDCRSSGVLHVGEDDDTQGLRAAAKAANYGRVVLGAESVLEIPAVHTREEYFAALRSRRRVRTRKEISQYESRGLHTVVRTGPDAITDDLVLLQARLRAKHGMSGDVEPVRREFENIRDSAGDSVVVFTTERDGETLGFALCLHDRARGELHTRSTGFDDEALHNSGYFVLLYHEVPSWGAENGVRRAFFGLSTYEAKRARGCRLLPLYGYLRFDGPEGDVLHRVGELQSLGEQRRLAALDVHLTS
ncbi:GNAT family N-acetyltransferase [Lentzea rhizosphaerae]|uniref:GNAT family N-acetyltransferase n=1 Tax=Lentzea rhizosphaerae TaxID=2041025 RepID=A0ABV8C7W1_9PSEU